MKQSKIRHFWELLWGMTEKELRARYKNTVIGFLWLVANPLLQMLIIGFIFPLFIQEPTNNYNYYLFTGLLVWNFFSLSLATATTSIVSARNLIKKTVFPRAVIPLSIILSHGIHFLAALTIFIIPLALLGTLRPLSLLYGAIGLSLLLIFLIGLSLLTSTLNVKYRDISFIIQAMLIIWFYATPILYSFALFPQRLLWVWQFNPLTAPFQWIQSALVGTQPPSVPIQISNGIIIFFIVVIGVWVFNTSSRMFDDWL